jgi:hypothetical protein
MKKKLIALILIIMTLLFVTSCEKKEEKATTVYFDFFGSRFDLQDRSIISEIRIRDLGSEGRRGMTFDKYIKKLEEDGENYVICRMKCIGDLRQEVDVHMEDGIGVGPLQRLYTEIPFEVVEILEGSQNLVTEKESLNIGVRNMFLYSRLFQAWYDEYKITLDIYGYDAARDNLSFVFACDNGLDSLLPRIGYEYVLVLIYDEETDRFFTKLNHHSCELSTPEDYISFKDNFLSPEERTNDQTPEERMSLQYWEILERYNIKVK